MAKKRKKLPEDFRQKLINGNIEELKRVFEECELEAYGGFGKLTALGFDECPHELAKWLVEKGADIHAKDTYGNTPLHNRARSIYGNIKSLLELGADVNLDSGSIGTPLHCAADSHNVENTKLLMEYGAKADLKNNSGNTPLDQALKTCRNIDIANTLLISRIYLNAGVQVTPKMKNYVATIGQTFEFHRDNYNKDEVGVVSAALEELYQLFGVEPIAKRQIHDGVSLIKIKSATWQEQHEELWSLLVPSNGPAKTIQGEVIRISGRIVNELEGNGGINWDADYKKMADAFLFFVKQGVSLSSEDLKEVEEIVKKVKQKSADASRLCQLAVKWVSINLNPFQLSNVDYRR